MYKTPSISEDEDDSTISISCVTKVLKEAGSYDPGLTNEEMQELYKALKASEATAEDEQRRSGKDSNSNFVDDMLSHSIPVENSKHSDVNDSPDHMDTSAAFENIPQQLVTNTKPRKGLDDFDDINVLDSVPTKHPPLPLITYKPKYKPPLYCDPKFKQLSLEDRKKVLTEYHKKLINMYDWYQRQSLHYAPLGKPIQPSLNFDGNLLKNNGDTFEFSDDDLFDSEPSSEIYITKTGRQTKRKLYTEPSNNPFKPTPSPQPDSPNWQPKKRMNISSLSNEQIQKRSKLFSPRAETLFDRVKANMEKEKQEEKENQKFIASLDNDSDDEFVDDSSDIAELVHSEEPFIRRRILPPSGVGRGKKPSKKRGRSASVKSKLNGNGKDKYTPIPVTEEKGDKLPSESLSSMGMCPICSEKFPQEKLAAHADECIDTYEQKSTSSQFSGNQLTCEKCDMVLPLTMEYEIHVRECLAKSK